MPDDDSVIDSQRMLRLKAFLFELGIEGKDPGRPLLGAVEKIYTDSNVNESDRLRMAEEQNWEMASVPFPIPADTSRGWHYDRYRLLWGGWLHGWVGIAELWHSYVGLLVERALARQL